MIIGIGCDIVQIPRIEAIYLKFGMKFLCKIFSTVELEYIPSHNLISYIAKRYAAKEAFSKAIGLGIGQKFQFKTIEILKDHETGRPYFSNSTLTHLGTQSNFSAHLSMSDDPPIAIANVILCRSN